MTQNQPTQVVNYAEIGEQISYELAAKMVKDYNDAHSEETAVCFTIGRKIIEQALANPNCVAMRFYNAFNEIGEKTLVYIGVDEKGRPLMEAVVTENGKLENSVVCYDRSAIEPIKTSTSSWSID